MASVCGSTLSLMAAGVPLKAAVAGIAMGLVYDEGTYVTLTDILGSEDAFGDMDFKVAGTADAVTALQLDTKIAGLPADVLAKALLQAKEARLTILGVMAGAIAEPRDHVANSAPKIVSMEIPIDKIGEVIGPKGKVINTLQQETGADIAVDDDGMVGTVTIGAKDGNAVEEARRRISLILDPPTADVGAVYAGKVVNITKFGAFVNVLPGRDGLLHISKLSPLAGGKRINNVEDVLTLGQPIEVRVDDIDPQGKVSLSLASVPEGTAEASSGDSSGGGGDRDRGDRGDRDRGDRGRDRDRGDRGDRGERGERNRDNGPSSVAAPAANGVPSFEDAFEAELVSELGDLGPGAVEAEGRSSSGGDRRPPRGRSRRR
jgi:polyribonucleotide nucleotidyltransferase